MSFIQPSPFALQPLRRAITASTRKSEVDAVGHVLSGARLQPTQAANARDLAWRLARRLREQSGAEGRAGLVQGLLQEYALSSQEGVALMCLAEALLRIPDDATRDRLIRDKIVQGRWREHLGRSPSLFVNAATWGLLVTGRLAATHSEAGLSAALGRLVVRGGEPLIRRAVDMAMRMMGEQFVAGEDIAQALERARVREAQGFRHSFDMLGEAAMTARDAERYLLGYEAAIHAIGRAAAGRGIQDGPGISIKLSALHPRYVRAQQERVIDELLPVLVRLCALAARYDIGLNIDAEEADRLELSLDLLEMLCLEPQLRGWNGLGFVIQAYQKRCPHVIDHLVELARRSGRRLMIRLVKGAYWDTEIKRAQVEGHDDYPVYTCKAHTDAAYIACARRLLAAPDAVFPQFATHNAHTLAAIHELADPSRYTPGQYEFQCLHGMGEPLYEQVVADPAWGGLGRPCRIYAPVGTHETLLAYLVRRLLENGANTSFVNRVADPEVPLEDLLRDPVDAIESRARARNEAPGCAHPALALPCDLYGDARRNSGGLDLSDESRLGALSAAWAAQRGEAPWMASPMLGEPREEGDGPGAPVINPADHADVVGFVREATTRDVDAALVFAVDGAAAWAATAAHERARLLEAAGDALESARPRLMHLLMREAGKTASNAVAEVREAVDFLRYYAQQAREPLAAVDGLPLGPVACISPWNFPLAIFIGQVGAALAAGNVVLAKPAEQTPLVAAEAVRTLWAAGVPRSAVQLLPGVGEVVGARLVADPRAQGVLFTGSTSVARVLQRELAGRVGATGRAIPLVAETGGQNAMIVDSSALAEQVVADVIASAFDSAGQRCSALRVLCVQEEVADRMLEMLLGAMAELVVGDPARLSTDVGPVIDEQARNDIERYVGRMREQGWRVHRVARRQEGAPVAGGLFVLPTLIEIGDVADLGREVFGPVLHLVRFRREGLQGLVDRIAALGHGLTLGLHTRIDETIAQVSGTARVGNVYVNRNMVGAVVGVQPFGGEGLSGTGPKAGGPLYLWRLLRTRPGDVLPRATAGLSPLRDADGPGAVARDPAAAAALQALHAWSQAQGNERLVRACAAFSGSAAADAAWLLRGPTGERNIYRLLPRSHVLCLAGDDIDSLVQLAAVLAVGTNALWPTTGAALRARLPMVVQARIALVHDWAVTPGAAFDAVLLHGTLDALGRVQAVLAARDGPVVGVERLAPGEDDVPLERLVIERSLSINTTAAGGNASLMTVG